MDRKQRAQSKKSQLKNSEIVIQHHKILIVWIVTFLLFWEEMALIDIGHLKEQFCAPLNGQNFSLKPLKNVRPCI